MPPTPPTLQTNLPPPPTPPLIKWRRPGSSPGLMRRRPPFESGGGGDQPGLARSSLQSSRSSLGGRQTRRTQEMQVRQPPTPPPSPTPTRFIGEVRPRSACHLPHSACFPVNTHIHAPHTHQVVHTQKTHTHSHAQTAQQLFPSPQLISPLQPLGLPRPDFKVPPSLGALSRDSLREPLRGLRGSRGSRGLKLIFFLFGPAQPSLASCHQARRST